jgi:hypothetical protein
MMKKLIKCKNCSYQFDPLKEGNSRKRKCGMCCFGDSYSVSSSRQYNNRLVLAIIKSQEK